MIYTLHPLKQYNDLHFTPSQTIQRSTLYTLSNNPMIYTLPLRNNPTIYTSSPLKQSNDLHFTLS